MIRGDDKKDLKKPFFFVVRNIYQLHISTKLKRAFDPSSNFTLTDKFYKVKIRAAFKKDKNTGILPLSRTIHRRFIKSSFFMVTILAEP